MYGEYKTYDPVGELYYESLRYIQGLSPTPEAVSGITTAMKDGFPVYDTWTDPHPAVSGLTDYSCLKNSIVAIGDVNTHADKFVPGNDRVSSSDTARTANAAANEPDFKFWTKVVGGFEANQAVSYADNQGRDTHDKQSECEPTPPDGEWRIRRLVAATTTATTSQAWRIGRTPTTFAPAA